MKDFVSKSILPSFGLLLQQLHTLCTVAPNCVFLYIQSPTYQQNPDYLISLLFDILSTFPSPCLPAYEQFILLLLKAYPSVIETYLQVRIQQSIKNYANFHTFPPVDSLKEVFKQRTMKENYFTLSRLCKNYQVMKMVCQCGQYGLLVLFVDCRLSSQSVVLQ